MKRTFFIPISLLLASALAATSAPAQPTSPGAQDHRGQRTTRAQPQRQQRARQRTPRTETQRQHQARHRAAPRVQRYSGPRDYRAGRQPPQLHRPRTFQPRDYRRNYRSVRRYRAPRYVRPQGWYSHRWIFGDILPGLFWTRNYWIVDYWRYGLPIPPLGYVWVRYGSDALLVEEGSGEILQVIYGVFY